MQTKKTHYLIYLLILTIIITFCSFSCSPPSPGDQTIEEPAEEVVAAEPVEKPSEEIPEEEVENEVVIGEFEWFQTGNTQPITQLQPKQSRELADNRIGGQWPFDIWPQFGPDWLDGLVNGINNLGLKWVRTGFDYFDWSEVERTGEYSKHYIDPNEDETITALRDNGIKIMVTLVFWDEAVQEEMKGENFSRFRTEEEVQRYLEYVRFIVRRLKGRAEYYELLNEQNSPGLPGQHVELANYINLVKRTVPVIRQEDPRAKIVVGTIPGLHHAFGYDYFFGILKSDVMPLVDAISWHPMYGASPGISDKEIQEMYGGPEYYYNYPSLVQEIKDVASAHGFKGEYIAEELVWRTPSNPHPTEPSSYSDTVAAKYYARGIVMHLGMDITVGLAGVFHDIYSPKERVIQNLCTVMAGAEPTSLLIEIQSEATNIRSYSFSLPGGDTLIALWTDGIAVDEDLGVKVNLIFHNFTAQKVMGIDVLNGFEQQMVTNIEDGNLVISNLLVKDYPIILRLSP